MLFAATYIRVNAFCKRLQDSCRRLQNYTIGASLVLRVAAAGDSSRVHYLMTLTTLLETPHDGHVVIT